MKTIIKAFPEHFAFPERLRKDGAPKPRDRAF